MKSVVVEASTVAKAIEAAWLKADKPEEFFIRVLQEHSSGFLGFGAQKAKVVFFFKNSQKSDSLFPVVVKQKEYANLFGNFNLKVPTELNVVDNELNKSVALGGQHKKKPHNSQNNQNNQQKAKPVEIAKRDQHNQQPDMRFRGNVAKVAAHPVGQRVSQDNFADAAMSEAKQVAKQVKVQHNAPKQLSHDKVLANEAAVNKLLQPAPKMQVSLQAPSSVKTSQQHKATASMTMDKKEGVVKDVANALKKIQSQKIIANVSSPKKTIPKQVTTKFESYEDFINSTTGIPVEKELVGAQIPTKSPVIEAVEFLHKSLDQGKVVDNALHDVVIAPKEEVAPVISQPSKSAAVTPRVPLKFKRRPLSTENSDVSGVVKSSDAIESVQKTVDSVADVNNLDDKK